MQLEEVLEAKSLSHDRHEEEKAEYARLLQELADLMENTERETTEFEQEMTEVQVSCNTIQQGYCRKRIEK